ncbi:MAG: hypothetical protein NZ920_05600 [Aigarchaeota archaeon]|nr:hypothetical protein [Aigarchaeota archaeon]MDW8092834.1 hypothetical protein [Nitrososphaerota archaeon]
MRTSVIIGILVSIGVLVQIALGESGLVHLMRIPHAILGYLGVVLVAVYYYLNRKSKTVSIIALVLLILTVLQAIEGSLLFFGLSQRTMDHRILAYVLLAVGLIGGILAARFRRTVTGAVEKTQ